MNIIPAANSSKSAAQKRWAKMHAPLLTGALAAAAFAVPTASFAQTAATGSSSETAATDPQSGAKIQEIVVTAERRQTTVQRTAATVEVVGAQTLDRQRIVNLSDLNSVLNDTEIVPIGIATQVIIRGIGNNFVDPRADPSVATSVNGLFYARPLPLGFAFLDVARVENLEGPQGTLYGRNAAGGALNIITNQPVQKWEGNLQVSGGNLGENQVTAVINAPVTDTLAIRAAYDRNRRDGYVDHYYDDVHTDTGRISVAWHPNSKFTAYAEGNYEHVGGHGSSPEPYPCAGAVPFSTYDPPACNAIAPGTAARAILSGNLDTHVASALLHLDYDLGIATVSSISGYVDTREAAYLVSNGSYFSNTDVSDNRDYSEELRFAGHDNAAHRGGLAWQIGAYLFDSHGEYTFFNNLPGGSHRPPFSFTTYSAIPQSSEAGYAQATYGVTDKLRVTAGIRYTHDKKGITYSSYTYAPPFFLVPGPANTGTTSSDSSKFTYKGGLEYDLAQHHLLYATISTGYASSGVNGGNASVPIALPNPPFAAPANFAPETITAYEVGSKNRFFNDRVTLNGDFYYYKFHNYQYLFPSFLQGAGFVHGLTIQDIGGVKAYGAEASAEIAATANDRLSGSIAWSHATFGALNYAAFAPPATAFQVRAPSGSALPNDPHWSGLLGYEHTFRLQNDAAITFGVNSKISSRYLLVVGSTVPADYQSAYTQTDLNLTLHLHNDKYRISGWVKNIENSVINVYGEGASFNLYGVEPPRTYGVTARAAF